MKSIVKIYIFLALCLFEINVVHCAARGRGQGSNQQNRLPSEVRSPVVEALSPRGLRVSIPDIEGLQLFAFHGKINARIGPQESGSMSKDITSAINGRWIFEDKTMSLRIGDVVHYWIYLQINGQGHRVDRLSSVITELIPCDDAGEEEMSSRQAVHAPAFATVPISTTSLPFIRKSAARRTCQECECSTNEMDTVNTQLPTAITELQNTNDKLAQSEKEYQMLRDLLTDMLSDMNTGTKLLLHGATPQGNSLEVVRNLISDKLGLVDLEEKINNARATERGIEFEMASSIDKKRILLKAKKLQSTSYKISDPEDPESIHSGKYLLDERITLNGHIGQLPKV